MRNVSHYGLLYDPQEDAQAPVIPQGILLQPPMGQVFLSQVLMMMGSVNSNRTLHREPQLQWYCPLVRS